MRESTGEKVFRFAMCYVSPVLWILAIVSTIAMVCEWKWWVKFCLLVAGK